jgi:hypothetical protein
VGDQDVARMGVDNDGRACVAVRCCLWLCDAVGDLRAGTREGHATRTEAGTHGVDGTHGGMAWRRDRRYIGADRMSSPCWSRWMIMGRSLAVSRPSVRTPPGPDPLRSASRRSRSAGERRDRICDWRARVPHCPFQLRSDRVRASRMTPAMGEPASHLENS